MSCWPELIVALISVPKIPCRLCWKTFAQDCVSSSIMSLAGRRHSKIKKVNQKFLENPYQAGKDMLDPKCAIQLRCDQSSLDTFNVKTLSDPSHNILLPPLVGLPPPTLLKDFNSTSVRYQDLLPILNSRRNASSPGINMSTYKFYKICPWIILLLFKIFKSCLKLSNVPIQ